MATDDLPSSFRYVAFISYNHADRRTARWLHRAIETYKLPAKIRRSQVQEQHSTRLSPVFIDREELSSSSDLAESVRTALSQSAALIVVCSPNAARSRWVNEEIRTFKSLGRSHSIFCLIASGEPGAVARSESPELECFPEALRYEVRGGAITDIPAAEPLAADIRAGADARRGAKLKIIAGLLGVSLDDLRQREHARHQRLLVKIGAASMMGCIILAGLTIAAWLARNEAERQRKLAVEKSLTAQRTAEFVISLFRVSDPSEARGNTITAREILDRGAKQIESSLLNEPQVRADLSTTLGEVYTGLGSYGAAFELLSKAQAIPEQSSTSAIRAATTLGELETQRDNYEEADKWLARAEALRIENKIDDPLVRARILLGQGEIAAVQEHTEKSLQLYENALSIASQVHSPEINARSLEGLGMAAAWGGKLPDAERWYTQALNARIALSGESHPRVSDLLSNLGSVAYLSGDTQKAEQIYLQLLDIDQRVVGPNHPEVASTMMNIGRLRLERREFDAAISILNSAITTMLAQRDETRDIFAFAFGNLGLAYMHTLDYTKAEPYFQKGLRAAVVNNHRTHAPILADLADLECRTKRYDAGLAHLAEAHPLMAERYPDDPWRIAWVDNVRGSCLLGLGRIDEATSLLTQSAPIILKKWNPDSLYGYDVKARLARLQALTAKQ